MSVFPILINIIKIIITVLTLLIIISLSFTLIGCPPAPPKEEVEEPTPEEIKTTEEERVLKILKKIVFLSYRDGNGEIYIMNADGSEQTNLTNNPADDIASAWSPNGK